MGAMIRWMPGLVALVALYSCANAETEAAEGEPSETDEGGARQDSPHDLPALLKWARAREDPEGSDVDYMPVEVTLRERPEVPVDVLQKDEEGRPILAEGALGLRVVYDPTRADPITAKAACLGTVTRCLRPVTKPEANLDSCFASVPTCQSAEPWTESGACCPATCKTLYEALRKDDYSQIQSFSLASESMCFPGLGEMLGEAP